jgi:hypothetical protein
MQRHLQLVVSRPKHEPPRPAKVVQLEARRQARAGAAQQLPRPPFRPAA